MTPKLSICIATFNRAGFIGATLANIAEQLTEEVEVVVVDGASTDDTEQVVRRQQQVMPGLRYVRLARNGGVDRDFDATVEHAQGDYCWLMTDDDLLMPGAVAAVLQGIRAGYPLVLVNSEARNLDLSRLLEANRLRLDEDRVYAAADIARLFEDLSGYLSYIGAVVIRRDVWLARNRQRYYGSFFIHVGVIFQAPLTGEVLVIARPLISIRCGNTQWRSREFEIRMICWTDLVASLTAIPEAVRRKCYRPEPWRSVISLFFYRAKGTYSLEEYRRWIRPRVTSLMDRARAVAVALIPGFAANLVGLLVCSFSYQESKVHLLEMRRSRFYFRNWRFRGARA
jgi:abequosyltransferase